MSIIDGFQTNVSDGASNAQKKKKKNKKHTNQLCDIKSKLLGDESPA